MHRHAPFVTRHSPFCILDFAFCIVVAANAATTYTWQNTDGTGVLNTPENWSPTLASLVASDVYAIQLPADGAGGLFRLDGALTSSTFRVSGGASGGTPAVFDLGGHALVSEKIGNTGYINLYTGNPLVFRNGEIVPKFYFRLGVQANPETPVMLAFTNVVAQSIPNYTRYAQTVAADFSDCFLTNFPRGGAIGSNTHLEFHNTVYSLATASQYYGAYGGKTNVTMRFTDGCTFGRTSTSYNFGGGYSVSDCRYSFESGSDLRYGLKIAGARNAVAFTNADLFAQFVLDGSDSAFLFHDSIISNVPASGYIVNTIKGTGNLLSFTGARTWPYIQYLDLEGTGNGVIFGEGVRASGYPCEYRVKGVSGHSLRADPGSVVRGTLNMSAPGCVASFTNATYYGSTFSSSGAGNRILFHDTVVSNFWSNGGCVNTISGSDALLSFTGPGTQLWTDYIALEGTRQRLVVGEGTALDSRSCTYRVNSGSGHSFRADSGSVVRGALGMAAPGSVASFTNSLFYGGAFTSSGAGNRVLFHDTVVSNFSSRGTVNSLSGSDGLLSFTGAGTKIWTDYIDIGGERQRFVFGDGIVLTNRLFNVRFSNNARDAVMEVGTNCLLRLYSIDMKGRSKVNTNIVVRIGKGSKLIHTVRGDMDYTVIGGVGSRFILDDAVFRWEGPTSGQMIYSGGSVELLGDDARIDISNANGGSGGLYLGTSIGADVPPLTLAFRPGPTGYRGEPPVSAARPATGYILPTVVFDVDATEYVRGKPGGIHEIPLIKKGKLFGSTNLDSLNAIGVFEPANGRLAFDADDNLVFRFKRDIGTRLMLR